MCGRLLGEGGICGRRGLRGEFPGWFVGKSIVDTPIRARPLEVYGLMRKRLLVMKYQHAWWDWLIYLGAKLFHGYATR